MTIINITAGTSNGVRTVTTAQTKAANSKAACVDEAITLNIDNALIANDTVGTKIEFTNSIVKIPDRDYAMSYGSVNTAINSQVNVVDSMIHWNLTTARKNLRMTKFQRSQIRAVSTNADGVGFVYTQAGNQAVLDDSVFNGIYVHEVSGVPLVFQDCQYKNCGINLLNWEAGDLTVRGVTFGSGTLVATSYTGPDGVAYTNYDAWLGAGNAANRFRFVDCTINLSKVAINLVPATGTELCFKSFTRNEKYVLDSVALSAANAQFTPTASSGSSFQAAFNRSITSNGYLTDGVTETIGVELLTQTTVDLGTQRNTGLAEPSTARNVSLRNITWLRRLRRADILESVLDVTPASRVGKSDDVSFVNTIRDQNFTGTYTQAAALTGISFAYNSGTGYVTVTLTAARSTQEIYNAWKHWTSQIAQFAISQSKITIVNGVLVVVGTVVMGSGGSLTGVYNDLTGTRVELNVTVNQPDARLYIKDNNGADSYNAVISGTTAKIYYPPGSQGIWKGAVELYGYVRSEFTIDLTGGGVINVLAVMVPDATIVAPKATISAAATLPTIQNVRDWVAYYNQTQTGIRAPINARLSSDILSLDTASLTTGGAVGYTGGVLSTGVATLEGDLQTSGVVTGAVNGTIYSATVVRSTAGVWNPSLNGVTLRLTAAGTFDLRTASIKGTLTLTNTSGSPVIVQPPPLAVVANSGPNITLDYKERLTISSADGIGLSSLILVNGAIVGGNPIAGWVFDQKTRYVDVNSNDTVSVYAHAYGYKPRIVSGMGAFSQASIITLVPEAVDTSLDTATRDMLSTHFSAGIDAGGSVSLAVNIDMSEYTPEAVTNALHYYLVKLGYMAAAGALVSGTVGGYSFIDGGLVLHTNRFYGKIADSVTTLPDSGIYLPLYVEVDPAVTAAYPDFRPVKKNSSGLLLSHALWTKQAAALTLADRTSTADLVRSKVLPDIQAIQPGATILDIRGDLTKVENRIISTLG